LSAHKITLGHHERKENIVGHWILFVAQHEFVEEIVHLVFAQQQGHRSTHPEFLLVVDRHEKTDPNRGTEFPSCPIPGYTGLFEACRGAAFPTRIQDTNTGTANPEARAPWFVEALGKSLEWEQSRHHVAARTPRRGAGTFPNPFLFFTHHHLLVGDDG
jgi:hypothetical protein